MATIITTAAGLAAIDGSSDDFELGADIVWNLPAIEEFYGTLDGKGYTISGTMAAGSVSDDIGLIVTCEDASFSNIIFDGCVTASPGAVYSGIGIFIGSIAVNSVFTNIQFKNCDISFNETTNSHLVGMLTPSSTGCSFTQCSADEYCVINITASEIYPGMLHGSGGGVDISTFSQCYTKGTITVITSEGGGADGIGGAYCAYVNCYSQVNITITAHYQIWIGGIVASPASLVNCYYSGAITYSYDEITYYSINGLGGDFNGGTATASYWKTQSGVPYNNFANGIGTETSDANMKLQATYSGWNFTTIWAINEGVSYPTLQWVVPAATIETLAAKNISDISAIVGGKYTGTTTVEAGISWRRQGVGMWNTKWWAQSPFSINSTTTFWFALTGLGPGLTYEFKAFYKIGTGYTYGSTLTFTTTITPAVFVYPGIEYRTAKQAIDDVAKIGVGRYYADHQGNFQYESRLRRNA